MTAMTEPADKPILDHRRGTQSNAPEVMQSKHRDQRGVRGWLGRRCATVMVASAFVVAFTKLWPGMMETGGRESVSAISFVAFLLRSFEFHMGLGLVLLTVIAVVLRAKRSALLGVVLCAVTLWPAARSYVATGMRADASLQQQPSVRVLSINLLVHLENFDGALREIDRIDPDVLCFIEYTPRAHVTLSTALAKKFPHSVIGLQNGAYGQAVFSRLPFVDSLGRTYDEVGAAWSQDVDMGTEFLGPQIRVVVRKDEWGATERDGLVPARRLLAVRCIHLMSPGSPEAVADQRREIRQLQELVRNERAKWPALVLAGDFNCTPNSAQMNALREIGLEESFEAMGMGRGTTWPRITELRHFPNIRIDHVMTSDPLRFMAAGKTEDFGSDHRGVWADVVRMPEMNGNK